MEIAFMVFGLVFFCTMAWFVTVDERQRYDRRVMEAREFGFGGKNQHTVKTLKR